jgi:L,D-transpeptidase ErfK/SrfK
MRAEDPTLPAVVPPGPENPMGTHSMYLGWPSYAIHGTDKPYSIGRRLSSGCIRMYPEDIITLYDNVKPGTLITVVDQPVKTAWIDDKYYVQVHPTQEQSDTLSHDGMTKPEYPIRDDDIKTILAGVGPTDGVTLQWDKIRSAVKDRRGIPIIVATKNDKKLEPATSSPSPRKEAAKKDQPQKNVIKKDAGKKETINQDHKTKNQPEKKPVVKKSTGPAPTQKSSKGDVPPAHGVKPKE